MTILRYSTRLVLALALGFPLAAFAYSQPYYQPYYQSYYQPAYSTSGSALNFSGDYTIDLWVNTATVSGSAGIISRDTNNGYSPYLIYRSGSTIQFYSSSNVGNAWDIASGVTICSGITVNTWYHVAVVRSGVNYYLYCNGNRVAPFSSALTPYRAPYSLVIGRQYTGGVYFNGYLDEVRMSNVARWTGTTFTVPTAPYTSDANTVLLLHMDDERAKFYGAASNGYFSHQPPAGFKAVSTANLAAPAVDQPSSYFNAFTYTGNNSSQTISTGFAPAIVWIKNRSAAYWNTVSDTLRGANSDLFTNSSNGATQNDSNGWINAFTGTTFAVGGQCIATPPQSNLAGNNYISWAWKKSAIAGIDVVSYTGDGATSRTVSHSLGTTPDLIVVKRNDAASDWFVWASSLDTPASYLKLNTQAAQTNASSPFSRDLIPTMTAATTNGITMSASSEWSSQYAWKAGDKNFDTYYESNANAVNYPSTTTPQWLMVNFGAGNPQTVGAYTIKTYTNRYYKPLFFTFEASNDGTNWTVLDTREWVSWRVLGYETQTFSVPTANRGSYQYYRVKVTKTNQAELIISELNLWDNATLPSSSQFNLLTDPSNNLNAAGGEYVAYLFSNREGFQKTGTFLGNASSDGPFVYTGFKPKFVMIKNTTVSDAGWMMLDSTRSTTNPLDLKLAANSSAIENDSSATQGNNTNQVDFYSNGFKLRSGNYNTNTYSGSNCYNYYYTSCYNYLYVAFADVPFKTANTSNGYSMANSLRFETGNSKYLTRQFTSTTQSRKKMTFSFWVKRNQVGNSRSTIVDGSSANNEMITFENDQLMARFANAQVQSSQVFRDTSKWYHVVVAYDSTQPNGGSPRTRMYVDGREITSFNTTPAYPNQNTDTINWGVSGNLAAIGRDIGNGTYNFDGNIADFYFIDGQALTPSFFGAFDGNGYWKPKAYTDVYGTNGFYLNFTNADNLGSDASGRGNDWKPQNITQMDQVSDTPTNNFTTLAAPYYYSPHYGKGTIQAGGLAEYSGHGSAANWQLTSGKWYWEYIVGGNNGSYPIMGVFKDATSGTGWRAYPGHDDDSGFGYSSQGIIYNNSWVTKNMPSGFVNYDVIGVAYDADTGKISFSKNGVWQNADTLIPLMNAQTTSGVTITDSSRYSSSYNAWYAADGNYGTGWDAYPTPPSVGAPQWMRVDFGAGKTQTVGSYSIKNWGSYGSYDPLDFTLDGSNDAATCAAGDGTAGSVWTTLDTETDVVWNAPYQTQYYSVASPAAYRCYRLKVTRSNGNAQLLISDFGLYAANASTFRQSGYNGIVTNGTPGLDSNGGGPTYVNFGQGGTPGVTFKDSSPYNRQMVETGWGALASSTIYKFGGYSLYVDNSPAGALSTPATTGLNVTGDFTIDLWAYPISTGTSGGVISRDSNNGYSPYMIYQNGTTFTFYGSTSGGGWEIAAGQTICSGVTVNTWYHLAVVRSGSTYSLYCNGTRTTTFTNAGTPQAASFPLVVGRQYNGGAYFRGYVDEVRFSNTARWTGTSFTVPTSEYSADGNTLLLLHMANDKTAHFDPNSSGYFVYTPPSGYMAVNSGNLPSPVTTKPVSYFDAKAYSGNAGSPSFDAAAKGAYINLSNNNFDVTSATNCCWTNNFVYSTNTFSTGKWYAEFKQTGNYPSYFGIGDASKRQSPESVVGNRADEYSYYPYGGQTVNNNVYTGSYGGFNANDIYMVAVDMGAGKIWFGKNGNWFGSGNPTTGANPQYSGITGTKAFAISTLASAGTIYAYFGQSGRIGTQYYGAAGGYFNYTPPAGFMALPTVSSQDISLAFKPDLVWLKNRTQVNANVVVDSARGADKTLYTNSTSAGVSGDTAGSVTSFNSPGFTVGAMCSGTTGTGNVNANGNSYSALAWAQSAISGVDLQTYTSNGNVTQLVSHALGVIPDLIITKRTDNVGNWFVNLPNVSPGEYEKLNLTDARAVSNSPYSTDLIPVMTAATTDGVTMTASYEYSSNYAWRAGDKDPNSYWSSYPNYVGNNANPQWLRVDFGSGNQKTVAAFSIKVYNPLTYYYEPQDFNLEGSNDATTCAAGTGVPGSVWTVLDTETSVDWIVGEVKTFRIADANQAAYRCYRLKVTRVNASETIIPELNLWAQGAVATATKIPVTRALNQSPTSYSTISYTGSRTTYTVPAGVTQLSVKMWGAGGYTWNYGAGGGGYTGANIAVTPGQVLTFVVGGLGSYGVGGAGGYPGGGMSNNSSGSGGGYTAIFNGDCTIGGTCNASNVLVVAGGGGGASYYYGWGGAGGGASGQDGYGANGAQYAGKAGTQSAGGSTAGGTMGTAFQGGHASIIYAGGGGGGYYGGSSGGGTYPGGGGGGSGYCGGIGVSGCTTTVGYTTTAANASDPDRPSNCGAALNNGCLLIATNGGSTPTYVSYIFANKDGFQRSGLYYGNGSSDGPVIFTGFKPRFVMVKDITAGNNYTHWTMYDSARDPGTLGNANLHYQTLYANLANVEGGDGYCGNSNCPIEFLPSGFKVRSAGYWNTNNRNDTYVYIAFAEAPLKREFEPWNGYSVPASLRLDSSIGAYLSRSLTTTGTRTKHTFSAWVKRGVTGSNQTIFAEYAGAYNDTSFLQYYFNSSDHLVVAGGNTVWRETNDVFNDQSRWYHIVIAIDTTLPDSQANKRIRIYVDNREITTFWCTANVCYQ